MPNINKIEGLFKFYWNRKMWLAIRKTMAFSKFALPKNFSAHRFF